jgi:chemotaxis protein histidine kinase CheA/ActR/RegA family two-component response regulator
MIEHSSAMDAAEAELQQELREMFAVDTQQHLNIYFSTIQRLTDRSWRADIQELYRAIHTIKGGAVTVAADAMLHTGIVLEDLLSDLRYLEQAPTLTDRQLELILLEAGELLSSSIEIREVGDLAIERVQPTVARLTQLRDRVKELYLPDWNELKQLHQEFAEQGFDLVILDLEMAVNALPFPGVVPTETIKIAQATIAQLTQIGTEIELANGWQQLLTNCAQLLAQPDNQLWRSSWVEYFEILKACVKNSGELTDREIQRLAVLTNVFASETVTTLDLTPLHSQNEIELDLPDELDNFFGDYEQLEHPNIEDSVASETVTTLNLTPLHSQSEIELDLPDELDNFFGDYEQLEPLTDSVVGSVADTSTLISSELSSSIDDDELPDLLTNFFEEQNPESIEPVAFDKDNYEDPLVFEDIFAIDRTSSDSIESLESLDDFFANEQLELTQIVALKKESAEQLLVDDLSGLLDGFGLNDLNSISMAITNPQSLELAEIVEIEAHKIDSKLSEPDLTHELTTGNQIEATELASNQLLSQAASQPATLLSPDVYPVVTNEPPVEQIKRNVQIPVPLERLDKSAQQVVDTLLTARSVMNVSAQLQSQLKQLTNLTQESSQYVTRLRQLQDDYALLRNLSSDRDTNNNVTLERYRQGYTTINRLLENILRMSELGQEIETATYQNVNHLNALDLSISRLKDGIETSRLIPFRNLTLRARAILRDLTNRYRKPAELIAQNEQLELDAGVVQQLEPALLHLLRNAYDHGLECESVRLAAGKPVQGTIKVSLQRLGNLYRLVVTDDGCGIDREKIAQIARSKGFKLQQTNTHAELLATLCQPGFSSSSTVTEVSGRGVGLDVVVAQINNIGGKLSLETHLGQGTTFSIEVPAPQLLVPCVLLQVGERTIALPTDDILETALLSSMAVQVSNDEHAGFCSWMLTTSKGSVPAFDLNDYWQPVNRANGQLVQRSLPETAICIRTRQADGIAEIWSIADDLVGQSELLINPLPSPLIPPIGLLGVSTQPDGRPISILDPIALTTVISTTPTQSLHPEFGRLEPQQTNVELSRSSVPVILIVDDAAMMRRRFEASLNTQGFITHSCNDGLEALNWLQINPHPDLMITDVEMPNMDGFTLIDRLRQTQIDIPILVVSSRLSAEWGKEARRLGANDYLNKGFSTPELLQKVASLLKVESRPGFSTEIGAD